MVIGLRVQGSSLSRAWGALPPPTDLGCGHSAVCAQDFFIAFSCLQRCAKLRMSVLPPCWATKPTFPYVKSSSRDGHVPVDTNPNKEWVLPLPFSLFPYQSLFPSPKVHDKTLIFFWAKACFSHTWPWLLSLCRFLKAGLCITDPEWGLTYSNICLVFMLIEEFLFPGYLVSSQKKFE